MYPISELTREIYQSEPYQYYPLGKYIVVAPAVCGGRPTFKYTRLEVGVILGLLASGQTIQQVLNEYQQSNLTAPAIQEALYLAGQALIQSTSELQMVA
jgi:uncharacterized protein (DUF433 family)